MSGGDPLMTPGEAARALHVHAKTLTRWEQAGKLRAIRTLGGHRRYLASEITAIQDGWKRRERGGAGRRVDEE